MRTLKVCEPQRSDDRAVKRTLCAFIDRMMEQTQMERTLFTMALWAASAGATLLIPAPAPALAIHERTAPVVVTVALDNSPVDAPAPWTLILVGAAVLTFVAARRID